MRPISAASIAILLAILGAAPLHAVTVSDIVELTRAGMSDEVIVALIEADGTIFSLGAPDLVALKEAGVSQAVLLAILQSGRSSSRPAAATPTVPSLPAPGPEVPPIVVVTPSPPAPTPVYVPVPVFGWQSQIVIPGRSLRSFATVPPSQTLDRAGFGRFINDGWSAPRHAPPPTPPSEPVYWGWGGKLRPDAWGQPVPKATAPPE